MIRLLVLFLINIFVSCESKSAIHHEEQGFFNPSMKPGLSGYGFVEPNDILVTPLQHQFTHYPKAPSSDPVLEALMIIKPLGISAKFAGYNTLQHQPINPYIALLLSHYGRYVAAPGAGRGIYSYGAANNFHNNKPFGSYKINEEIG